MEFIRFYTKPKKLLFISVAAALIFAGFSSCNEDPLPPKAVVTVIEWIPTDTIPFAQAVMNAQVWFIPPAGASQPDVIANTLVPHLTDARGQVFYELKYESVIEYKVEKEVDGLKRFGYGTLIFNENEVFYDTIYLE
ncbi:MAG: hypothetical protein K9I34_03870 [Bacteroidales bacterium]|nr:hypothetical protein [Bacteroidales bacterium]